MRLNTYLQEARRSPKKNPKIDIVKAIEPYKDKKAYFMHFTDIPKLGVNPKASYVTTPMGIYAYPVREMFENLVKGTIPYRGDAKYVFLFKFTGKYLDVENYTDSMLNRDLKILEKRYGDLVTKYIAILGSPRKNENNVKFLIDIVLNLSDRIKNRPGNVVVLTQMNKIFRELGYDAIIDWKGKGVIHRNEPYQAVFFDIRKIQVVDMFENKRYNDLVIDNIEEFKKYILEIYPIDFVSLIKGASIIIDIPLNDEYDETNYYSKKISFSREFVSKDLLKIFDLYLKHYFNNTYFLIEYIIADLKKYIKYKNDILDLLIYYSKHDGKKGKENIEELLKLYKNKPEKLK